MSGDYSTTVPRLALEPPPPRGRPASSCEVGEAPPCEAATDFRPLADVLAASTSAFNAVIHDRVRRGDAPVDPAKVLHLDGCDAGLIEWPDGRWLVLRLRGGLDG